MLALLLLLAGCAAGPRFPGPLAPMGKSPSYARRAEPPPLPAPPSPVEEIDRSSPIAAAARYYLDHSPAGWRDDCSGFVCAVLDRAGIPLTGNTRSLWELAKELDVVHRRKVPDVGDVVFFDNTYDRNRNGRADDDLSHIAVVVAVEEDGTIVMAHNGTSEGRATLRMNLRSPDVHRQDGRVLNDWLRASRPGGPALSGELWRGFATFDEGSLDQF